MYFRRPLILQESEGPPIPAPVLSTGPNLPFTERFGVVRCCETCDPPKYWVLDQNGRMEDFGIFDSLFNAREFAANLNAVGPRGDTKGVETPPR